MRARVGSASFGIAIALLGESAARGQCTSCPGDMNVDGSVTTADIPGFVNCLVLGVNCNCADFNSDTLKDARDIRGFIQALLGGGGGFLIRAGLDCWKTTECADETSRYTFCDNPIPAGFFGPGSFPFTGGLSLGTGNPGGFDTNIRRMADLAFCGVPESKTVPLTIESLNLVSCQPITVQSGGGDQLWDVAVDLTRARTHGGFVDLSTPPCGGGSFVSSRTVGPPNCPQIFRLRVQVQIFHPRVGDLSVSLVNVDSGTTVQLMNRINFPNPPPCGSCTIGGNTTSGVNVIFDDAAAQPIQTQAGTVNNGQSYRPAQPLAAFIGQQGCGNWQLIVTDCATNLNGVLFMWALHFDPPPPPPPGTITVTRSFQFDTRNGGTFTSVFKVPARFTFSRISDGAVRVLDPSVSGIPLLDLSVLPDDPAPWVSELIGGVGADQYCDPGNGFPRNFFPALELQDNPEPGQPELCPKAVGHNGPGHMHITRIIFVPCDGACCLPGGECVIRNQPDCVNAGGTFKGSKITCNDTDGDAIPTAMEDVAYNATCGCQTSTDVCKTQTDPADPNTDGDGACDGCEVYVLGTNACNGADADPNVNCADCNNNGVCDPCEIAANYPAWAAPTGCNLSADCNNNLVPDDCEPDQDNDGIPDDCDPCTDADGDGYGVDVGFGINCPNGATPDCDDSAADAHPNGTESCAAANCHDGLDNDCDGFTDDNEPSCNPVGSIRYSQNPAVAIPDNNATGVSRTITVPDSGTILGVDVSMWITHTFQGDLRVSVTHNGTTVVVMNRPGSATGGCGASANGYSADNFGSSAITTLTLIEGAPPNVNCYNGPGNTGVNNYAGPAGPANSLASFNGMDKAGDWTITVSDLRATGTGTLQHWNIFVQASVPCP